MASTFKKKLLLHISLAIGLAAVFGVGTGLVGSDLAARAANIRTVKEQVFFDQQAFESLAVLTDGERRAERYTSYLGGLLPGKDSLFSFKNEISEIGKEERMVLGFKFGNENPAVLPAPPSVNFQLSASGPAAGFRKLMERLESSGYFIRVTAFDVSWIGKPGGEAFTGSIGGKVFYRGAM